MIGERKLLKEAWGMKERDGGSARSVTRPWTIKVEALVES